MIHLRRQHKTYNSDSALLKEPYKLWYWSFIIFHFMLTQAFESLIFWEPHIRTVIIIILLSHFHSMKMERRVQHMENCHPYYNWCSNLLFIINSMILWCQFLCKTWLPLNSLQLYLGTIPSQGFSVDLLFTNPQVLGTYSVIFFNFPYPFL